MYIIAEGDNPVCLCAHMDTVYPTAPNILYYDSDETVFWSPQGLGADDRAGIYIILSLIKRGFRPSIVFTDLEECGCIGAKALVADYPQCIFKDCRAIIELDRRGSYDAVYYECDNKDFEKLITSYGFLTNYGTFSDISVLAPIWGIAAVNLSIGYYNEHQLIETLNFGECNAVLEKVSYMLEDSQDWLSYAYIPNQDRFYTDLFSDFSVEDDFLYDVKCDCCGDTMSLDDGILMQSWDKTRDFYVCPSCYKTITSKNEASITKAV